MDVNAKYSCSKRSQPSKNSMNVDEDMMINDKNALDSLYVNHAEVAWHERRRAWVGNKSKRSKRTQRRKNKEPVTGWTTAYEDLLSTTEPYRDPIPLAEMVDFLVDIWIQDGLYT